MLPVGRAESSRVRVSYCRAGAHYRAGSALVAANIKLIRSIQDGPDMGHLARMRALDGDTDTHKGRRGVSVAMSLGASRAVAFISDPDQIDG